eukprot:tig00020629_g12437.t1
MQTSWHGKPLATTYEAGARAWRRRRARLSERCGTVAEAPKPRVSVLPSSPLPAPRVFTEESFGAHEFGYDSLDFSPRQGSSSIRARPVPPRPAAQLSRAGAQLWRQCPQTLTLSEENLERKWAALSREIGADGASRVFEETIAPTLSVENLLGKLDEVQGALGAPRRELPALAARMPGLLEVQGALGAPRRELPALAARMPGLLEADVPARAGVSFEYLGSLGLSRAEMSAGELSRHAWRPPCYGPCRASSSPTSTPATAPPCAPAPCAATPPLKAVPQVSFLLSTGFSPSDAALLIRRRPTLHRFSVTKYYSPLVMFLSRQGIHGPALVRLLRLAPELLGHFIESLRPKFEFMYAQHYSARDVISYPTALKCSFERRIRPRLLFLAGRGLRAPLWQAAPLCRALTLRDGRFAGEEARRRPEEWAAFLGRHAGGPAGTRGQNG